MTGLSQVMPPLGLFCPDGAPPFGAQEHRLLLTAAAARARIARPPGAGFYAAWVTGLALDALPPWRAIVDEGLRVRFARADFGQRVLRCGPHSREGDETES